MLAHSAVQSYVQTIVIVICDEYAVALSCLCQHWQMPALVSKQKVLHRIMLLQKEADLVPLLQCVCMSVTVCVCVSATLHMCVCYSVYVSLLQCVYVFATVSIHVSIQFSLAIRACLVIKEQRTQIQRKLEPECSMAFCGKHKSFTRLFPKFPRLFDSFTH